MLTDLRYALRLVRKNPLFAAAAIFVLAIGTGANTAVFSLLNAVLLRPLPFPEPKQLVRLWDSYGAPGNFQPVSYPNFEDWRGWNRTFSGMAVFTGWTAVLTGSGDASRVQGVIASANLFEMLGAEPMLGRRFLPEEDRPFANNGVDSIILSHKLWRERFGGDRGVLGKLLTLDGQRYAVVGVAPAGLDMRAGPSDPDFWVTAAAFSEPAPHMSHPVSQVRTTAFLDAVGRLRSGVSLAQAQADMDRVAGLIEKAYPAEVPKAGVILRDLQESAAGDVRPTLLLLLAAAGVVFLIACADVGGLMLARAMRRRRELIVRAAIGASRWQLARQLLVESVVLAAAGGAAGLWLAVMLGGPLARALDIDDRLTTFDLRVFAFAFAAAAVASVIFSLAPTLHLWVSDLIAGLRESSAATSDSRRQKRLHAALVTVQIALATVLLYCAGLLTLSMMRLQRVDLGFQPDHVLTFPVALPSARYPQERRAAVFEDLLARLHSLPNVRTAAASSQLPIMGGISRTVLSSVAGIPIPQNRRTGIAFASVTPGIFQSLGIAMRRGREFDAHDRSGAPPVVIINEAAARRYFPGRDPLGQQIVPEMWNGSGSPTQPRTIVGIAADVKMMGLERGAIPAVYWPVAQIPSNPTMFVTVLAQGDPQALINGVRGDLRAVDRDLPLYNVRPMSSYVDSALERPRRTAALVGLLTAFALTLTAVGIYGTVALSVARRTREIGIRMALGAKAADVLRAFVTDALWMSIAGVILAAPLVAVADKLIKGLMFGAGGEKSWMFAAGAVTLLAVAILASYLPARRATRIDPMVALRWE